MRKSCKNKEKLYTFKVCMNGYWFQKDNGVKEFFDKDYHLYGDAFILVKKNCLGSFELLRVVPLNNG